MSQLVKDLDLKAFHNSGPSRPARRWMSQLVKDLDLKAFHNAQPLQGRTASDVTARQRS